MKFITGWLQARFGHSPLLEHVAQDLRRPVPRFVNGWYALGTAMLVLLLLQVFTGILLSFHYVPTADGANSSVSRISEVVTLGWFVRSLHHWGSSAISSPNLPDMIPTLEIKEFAEFDTDYIAITRVDSDDMMHREAMAEIIFQTRYHLSDERTRLIFRKFWKWHMLDRVLEQQNEASPPFYTHIFPRSIYKDWSRFRPQHFDNHRYLGAFGPPAFQLSANKICVCSHQENISRIKRGKPLKYMRSCDKRMLIKRNPGSTDKRSEIIKHLQPFQVKEKEI